MTSDNSEILKMVAEERRKSLEEQIEDAGISLEIRLNEWVDRSEEMERDVYSYDNDRIRIHLWRWEPGDYEIEIYSSGRTSIAQLLDGLMHVRSANDNYYRIEAKFNEGKFVRGYLVNIDLTKMEGDINKRKEIHFKNINDVRKAIGDCFFNGESIDEFGRILYKSELPEDYRRGIRELIE